MRRSDGISARTRNPLHRPVVCLSLAEVNRRRIFPFQLRDGVGVDVVQRLRCSSAEAFGSLCHEAADQSQTRTTLKVGREPLNTPATAQVPFETFLLSMGQPFDRSGVLSEKGEKCSDVRKGWRIGRGA